MSAAKIGESFLDPAIAVNWDRRMWDRMMIDAATAGIKTVTLQSAITRDPNSGRLVAYYPSTIAGTAQALNAQGVRVDIISAAIEAARRNGLRIRLGLYRDEGSWIAGGAPHPADAALTVRLAHELWGQHWTQHAVIAGWYLPGEANVNYVVHAAAMSLAIYYERVVAYLHTHDNRMSVMISPYFNADAGQSASSWRALWAFVLTRADLNIIALQDGTGDTGKREDSFIVADRLDTWFRATRGAISDVGSSAQLWTNVNFYQYDGTTAPVQSIAASLKAVLPHVSEVTSFSYFNQIAPWTVGSDKFAAPFVRWNLGD